MRCDDCKKDFCVWTELSYNGEYIINRLNGKKIKKLVCNDCLEKFNKKKYKL